MGPKLPLITKNKSYTRFWLYLKTITLDDLKRQKDFVQFLCDFELQYKFQKLTAPTRSRPKPKQSAYKIVSIKPSLY